MHYRLSTTLEVARSPVPGYTTRRPPCSVEAASSEGETKPETLHMQVFVVQAVYICSVLLMSGFVYISTLTGPTGWVQRAYNVPSLIHCMCSSHTVITQSQFTVDTGPTHGSTRS